MATYQEMMDSAKENRILVKTRSGKEYIIYADALQVAYEGQVDEFEGTLVYGYPVNPHPRRKNSVSWFKIENLTIVQQ